VNAVFLDTVGLIPLWNGSDQWHTPAEEAHALIRQLRSNLVTTTHVLLECGNAVARTHLRPKVTQLRITLSEQNGLIHATEDDWNRGWEEFDGGNPGDAGIVDLVSFAVMRRLGINRAFTNDWHFFHRRF
jgi:predicted nucleic acid-binding protein